MKRLFIFLYCIVLGLKTEGQIVHPQPYNSELTRVESTALYLALDTNSQLKDALKVADKAGFNLSKMLRSNGFEETSEGWVKLKRELRYINEQTPKFQETFKNCLIEHSLLEYNADLNISYTATPNEYHLSYRPNEKNKLKAILVSSGAVNLVADRKGISKRKNGDWKVRGLASKGFEATLKLISDSSAVVTLVWKNGKMNSFSLPALKKEKPWIKSFASNTNQMIELQRIDLNWLVFGTNRITIDKGLGSFPSKWQVGVSPHEDAYYVLSASNEIGTSTDTVHVKVVRQKLVKVEMSFVTPPLVDPKETGLGVIVEIFDINQRRICSFDGLKNQVLSNSSKYDGPFNLNVLEDTYSLDLVRGEIRIQLKGEEMNQDYSWKFSPIFILTFSDGTIREMYGFGWKEINSKDKSLEVIKF